MRRIFLILMLLPLVDFKFCSSMVSFFDAQKSDEYIVGDSDHYSLYDTYTDDYGNMGVIVRIVTKTNHYKYIIAISADETEAAWGPMDKMVFKDGIHGNDTVAENMNFSLGMLQLMKLEGIERFPAQQWCDAKNNDELNPNAESWTLPSYKIMDDILSTTNLILLNRKLNNIGGTPIDSYGTYWTCAEDYDGYISIAGTESDYDAANRATLIKPLGGTFDNKEQWMKKNKHKVRAIKYVYYQNVNDPY